MMANYNTLKKICISAALLMPVATLPGSIADNGNFSPALYPQQNPESVNSSDPEEGIDFFNPALILVDEVSPVSWVINSVDNNYRISASVNSNGVIKNFEQNQSKF